MGFVHLHVHTEYSLLNGSCKIEELVGQAKRLGYRALAITDKDVVYGLLPFYKACKKEGIHPVLGLEITVAQSDYSANPFISTLLLYAKTYRGYQHLLALATAVQTSSAKTKAVDMTTIKNFSQDLIAVIPFHGGDIGQLLRKNDKKNAIERLLIYQQQFGNDLYIEIQEHENEERWIKELAELGRETNVPILASNHVHFVKKQDYQAYQAVNAIRTGSLLDTRKQAPPYYLKSKDEMETLFSEYQEALHNSKRLAMSCDVTIELGSIHMPKFPTPNSYSSNDYLKVLCQKGLTERYETITQEIQDRLAYELQVISKMGFSDYFLIVWDFMAFAHGRGILTGPGRGSAAGSLVAYVLKITNIDPIKYQLLFERFLNPERVSMPDIDIDFPDERREEVLAYVTKRYGSNHVAHILTFGTLAAKAAIRDVGKVLGTDSALVDKLARLIPNIPQVTLRKSAEETAELQQLLKQSEAARELFQLACAVEGLPRHTSTHAAGIIISDEPLTNRVALQEGQGTVYVTQFTMDLLEEIGLLKMDFLGLRNLTLLEEIKAEIEAVEGKQIKLDTIPLNDPRTFEMLGKGESTGVFQLESAGMRQVLKQLKPTEFEDIVAVNALFRPGPMENIPNYIARKHKKQEIRYPHPDLAPILETTYGVIVYQEQIMKIASTMAGFTLGQADLLRRAVSKKKRDILEMERKPFISGAQKNGYEHETAEEVYQLIIRFADYGFNRSHAVAYSMIAYQLAYLKANYPAVFYSSLLSGAGLHHDKLLNYFQEVRQCGLNILAPDINHSCYHFRTEDKGIRFGFMAIKHMGLRAADEIIQKRQGKPYTSLSDFCIRVDHRLVTKKAIEMLIIAGAFDRFEGHRSQHLASLDDYLAFAQRKQGASGDVLFSYDEPLPPLIDVPPFSDEEQLEYEKKMLGFYLSGHPITMYENMLKSYNRLTIASVLKQTGSNKSCIAGLYSGRKKIITKKGQEMGVGVLHDETSEINLVIFPNIWSRYAHMFQEGSLLLVEGNIERQKEKLSFIVSRADLVKHLPEKRKEVLYLRIEKEHEDSGVLYHLKNELAASPGKTDVILYYSGQNKLVDISQSYQVDPSHACVNKLKALLGKKNVVLKSEK